MICAVVSERSWVELRPATTSVDKTAILLVAILASCVALKPAACSLVKAATWVVVILASWVFDSWGQNFVKTILTHAGKLTHEMAEEHALRQFETYDAQRRQLEAIQPTSDFDKAVEEVRQLEKQTQDSPKPPRSARKRKLKREAD